MKRTTAIGTLALAALLLATTALRAADDAPPAGKPLVSFGGTDSGVKQQEFTLVNSQAQWEAVWQRHRGSSTRAGTRPEVDFTRCTVVALFMGSTHNMEGMEALAVIETKDTLTVRVRFGGYATGGNIEPDAVTPYGFVVLPKTAKTIVLEQDVTSRKGVDGPVKDVWKELARLPADAR